MSTTKPNHEYLITVPYHPEYCKHFLGYLSGKKFQIQKAQVIDMPGNAFLQREVFQITCYFLPEDLCRYVHSKIDAGTKEKHGLVLFQPKPPRYRSTAGRGRPRKVREKQTVTATGNEQAQSIYILPSNDVL